MHVKNKKMYQLILVLLFVAYANTQTNSVINMEATKVRINRGVVFHKMSPLVLGTAFYKHTFAIPIPQLNFTNVPHIGCETEESLLIGCVTVNKVIDDINADVSLLFEDMKAKVAESINHIPDIDNSVAQLSRGKRSIDYDDDSVFLNDHDSWDNFYRNRKAAKTTTPKPTTSTTTDDGLTWWERAAIENEKVKRYGLKNLWIRRAHGIRTRKRRELETLGPDYCKKLAEGQEPTHSNGFLGTIGNAWNSFWGQPTWADMATMSKHICGLADLARKNADQIVKTSEYFTSISNTINKRVDVLEDAMQVMRDNITRTNELLKAVAVKVYAGLNELETKARRILESNNLVYVLTGALFEFSTKIQEITRVVDRFNYGVSTLLSGRVDATMVEVSSMEKVLADISEQVAGKKLTLMERNAAFYYLQKNIVFSRSTKESTLYVMVKFPLGEEGGTMLAYKVKQHYMAVNQNTGTSTRIENLPDFFVVTPDERYYLEMSSADYVSCEGDVVKVCRNERERRKFTQLTCAAALYKDDPIATNQLCDTRFETIAQPSQAVQLTEHTYLLHGTTALSDNPGVWTTSCPLIDQHTPQTMAPCTSCVIDLPCGCEFTAPGEYNIGLQLSGCADLSSPKEVVPLEPINLAVGYSTLNIDDRLAQIKSDQVRKTWAVSIPDLKSTKFVWDESVEKSNLYSQDVKKLGEQLKKDSKAYATKADEALAKATDFRDLELNRVKSVADSLGSLSPLGDLPDGTLQGVGLASFIATITLLVLLIILRFC